MGSRENLKSPQSPTESHQTGDWGPPGSSRKNSIVIDPTSNRRQSYQEQPTNADHQQSTSEIFKDLLSQKRNMFLSKLTSFESEVSK